METKPSQQTKTGPAASAQGPASEQTKQPVEQKTEKPVEIKTAEATAEAPAETGVAEETGKVADSGFISDLAEVLSTSKSRNSGGSKIRSNIGYTLVPDGVKKLAGTNVPEQEQVILKILNRALSPQRPVISEPELNKLILAAHASGALKTKQDAWHIFRYYRTDLKKRGALREVEIVLAPAA